MLDRVTRAHSRPKLTTRRASLRPNSFDPEKRSFTIVIATDAPVDRGDHFEVIDMHGAALPDSLPLQLDHDLATEATVGRVSNLRVENGALIGDAQLSSDPDLEWLARRIGDGTVRGISIGFAATAWRTGRDQKTGKRTRTATGWTPREVSLVSDPADPNSGVRSMEKEDDVIDPSETETEVAEETNDAPSEAELRNLRLAAQALNLGADALSTRSTDDPENERSATRDALRRRSAAAVVRPHNAATLDNPAFYRRAMASALHCRISGETPQGAARELAAMDWVDLHRMHLRRSGIPVAGMSGAEIITRALATTDMPLIAGEAFNQSLRGTYEAAQSPIMALAGSRSVPDFRPFRDVLVDWTTLKIDTVNEHGEFKESYVAEDGEVYSVFTIGGITSLTRQVYINGAGALTGMSSMQGRRLAADEADRLVAYLEQSAGAGPKMRDNNPVFHASRSNIANLNITSVATAIDSVLTARAAMPKRKGAGDVMIGVFPKYWVVTPEFEPTAIRALATVQANSVAEVNPLAGKLEIVAEPRLTGANRSYLASDSASMDDLVKVGLSGAPGPHTESRWGFEVDAVQFKIRHDLGFGFVEWRGWTRLDHTSGGGG